MKIKRIIPSLLSIFIVLFMSFTVYADISIPKHNNSFYVLDEANVLDSNTENYIIKTNEILNRQTGAQIVVASVNSLQGYDIETYANEMFRDWGIGDKEKNNGVLLLIAPNERKMRIEVGYGLEGAIPDGKAGRIRDNYVLPAFKEENYNKGALDGYRAILALVQEEYNITIDDRINTSQYNYSQSSNTGTDTGKKAIFMIIIALVILDILFNRGRITRLIIIASSSRRRGGRGGFGGGGFGGGNSGGGGSSGGGGASGGW